MVIVIVSYFLIKLCPNMHKTNGNVATRQVEHRQIAFVSVASWVSGRVWLADPMPQRFPSKAWSCSDLVAGAAAVVDQMEGVPTDLAVVNLKRDLLQQTDGLGVQELQKMLQDK